MKTVVRVLFFVIASLPTTDPIFAQLPVVTGHPTNRTVWLGANANFTVAASGADLLSYQWQLDGTNLFRNLIATVAGIGVGDYRAATNSGLRQPSSLAVDAVGNLFIADTYNYRIRKVDTNGITTTVVGNGTSGYSPDGTVATNASIGMPNGVALDASGSLLFTEGQLARKVDPNGILVTVAGNGYFGFSGDGLAATNASLNIPRGLVADTFGNVFIADSNNNRIRKVDTSGTITTVAGSSDSLGFSGDGGYATNAALNVPSAVCLDKNGNLFIADTQNGRIRKVNTSGIISTVAGNGGVGYLGDEVSATNTSLSWPEGVTVDSSGILLIADRGVQRIRSVDLAGVISTLAGNGAQTYAGDGGAGTNASLSNPKQMALDPAGNLFVADSGNDRIRKVSADGVITTVAGRGAGSTTGDLGPALNVSLWNPSSVTVDSLGELFIADQNNQRICKVSRDGTVKIVAGNGRGGYSGDGGAATNAQLYFPYTITVDVNGSLFISDWMNNRVRKVSTNGIINSVAGNGQRTFSGDGGAATNAGLNGPWGLAVDSAGNLFIADHFNSRIRKVDTNGIIRTVAGGGSVSGDGIIATKASLSQPTVVALGTSGDLVIGFSNNRVRKIGTNGIISTLAGNGMSGYSGDGGAATNATVQGVWGVAIDSSGNVFLADYGNHVIRRVNPAGIIETVAGTGMGNYSGDGGPAAVATLCHPEGIAVDQFGNLFVAESDNHCIRKVTNTQGPTLALNTVSVSNAGNYQAVVTAASGSETSRVAVLTVATSPFIYGAARNGDDTLTINCVSQPNSTNVLSSATDLKLPISWQPVSTNLSGGDGNWQFTEPITASLPARLYRFFTR